MALTVDKRETESILILALVGELTMGPGDIAFRRAVGSSIAAGKVNVIVDCSRLDDIDSVGVGTLVVYQIRLSNAGGKMVLLNVSRVQMQLLTLAKLESIFEVFTNERDAVSSFFPDRDVKHYDILEFVEEQNRPAHADRSGAMAAEQVQSGACVKSISDSDKTSSIKPA